MVDLADEVLAWPRRRSSTNVSCTSKNVVQLWRMTNLPLIATILSGSGICQQGNFVHRETPCMQYLTILGLQLDNN
jgi:hypothetical protein